MLLFTDHGAPIIKCKGKDLGEQRFSLNEFIAVKGVKARGKRLSTDHRAKVALEDTPNPNLEVAQPAEQAPAQSTQDGPKTEAVQPSADTGKPSGEETQSTLF